MFNFLCKTSLLKHGNHTVRASSTRKFPDFHGYSSIYVKHVATTTSIPHSFTVSHLVKYSRGLSQESASASTSKLKSTKKDPNLFVEFFKSHGFTETQISKLIRGHPPVVSANPGKTLLPKLEFFYSKGFSTPELAKIFSVCPSLLLRSIENHVAPAYNYLIDVFGDCNEAFNVVKRSPHLLCHDVETHTAPNVNVLRVNGVPESNIQMFLRYWPRLFGTNLDTFKNTVLEVKETGINPSSCRFVNAVVVKGYGKAKWDSKASVYQRWGWSEEDVLAAFVRNPFCMAASEKKIMAVMDFLVNNMQVEPSAVVKRPAVISFSLEKRCVPRGAVFQFLKSKGLIKKKNSITTLLTMFNYVEQTFLLKFVYSYHDKFPQLLKLYQEKLKLSKTKDN